MANSHYPDSQHHNVFREQHPLTDDDALPTLTDDADHLPDEPAEQENDYALPELTEEVERLLKELPKQEVDVDPDTLQRVLEYARKA